MERYVGNTLGQQLPHRAKISRPRPSPYAISSEPSSYNSAEFDFRLPGHEIQTLVPIEKIATWARNLKMVGMSFLGFGFPESAGRALAQPVPTLMPIRLFVMCPKTG